MTDITTTETKVPRAAQAKHELIAEPKGPHTDIGSAIGIRYTDLKSGLAREFFPREAKPGTELTMLALFGAKTKATNEASRIRNGEGGDSVAQMEAVDELFDALLQEPPVWREKAEGGSGSRTDKELLAAVLIELLGTKAKGDVAYYVARFSDDSDEKDNTKGLPYMRAVLKSDAGTEYRKRAGKTGPAVDTLA
jgi:hypothetical protein